MRQIKIGTAALAAIAILAACSDDSGNDVASDEQAPVESSSVGSSGAGADPSESAAQPGYQTVPEESEFIEAGRWAVQASGPDRAPLAVFDVPEGLNGGGPNIWTNKAVIGYWTLDGVYKNPCSDTGAPPSTGDTIEELAAAFAAQKITTTTKAAPVSLGGHDGLYLELSTPTGFDTGSCHEDALLHIWPDSPSIGATDYYRYWILDVDGDRVLITLGAPAEATDETVQLFSGIVKDVTFDEAD